MIGTAAALLLALGACPSGYDKSTLPGGTILCCLEGTNCTPYGIDNTEPLESTDLCIIATTEHWCCVNAGVADGGQLTCAAQSVLLQNSFTTEAVVCADTPTAVVDVNGITYTSVNCFPPANNTTTPAQPAIGACPNTIQLTSGYQLCYHEGHTFDSDDDRVCSASTDGFDCCFWSNNSLLASWETRCYENAVQGHYYNLPCTDTLASLESNDNFVQSRNCSDHNHSALPTTTTITPAHACPGQFTGPQPSQGHPYTKCDFYEGGTFASVDDTVCSAATDGFECCYWQNASATDGLVSNRYYSYCYEDNTFIGLPCDNSLAETQVDSGIVHSRNCSDHNHSALPTTTTPPASTTTTTLAQAEQNDNGLSTGAVAGIAVGAVAFVGLAAAAAVCR